MWCSYKCFIIISLIVHYKIITALMITTSPPNEQTLPAEVTEFHPVENLESKIVSKSIFVAPLFQKCPDGYAQDLQGQCYRLLRVDEQAHWNNLVSRLNKFYKDFQMISTNIPAIATLPQPSYEYDRNHIGHDTFGRASGTGAAGPLRIQLPMGSDDANTDTG